MIYKNVLLIISLLLISLSSYAQEKGVRYTADFYFERGIYPTLDHWKTNSPIKPEDIITDLDTQSPKFFQYLLAKESFRYPAKTEVIYLKPEDIFGYSTGEHIYYSTKYRFETIGRISVLKEVDVVDSYSSFINPEASYEAEREEGSGKLYILDYETGKFFKCKPRKVKAIFKRDPVLYEEYKKAKGKRDEKIRSFIQEYNFKHPIYFPE